MSLILASQSPRRAELLRQLQLDFQQFSPNIDETRKSAESIHDYMQRMAEEKAQVGYAAYPNHVVIAADTSAEVDGQVLGKPQNLAESAAMLKLLSGREHTILTSFALFDGRKLHSEVVTSSVIMRAILPSEIERYWHTQEPVDKAGSYAIQGLGAVFVKEIKGSYSAVMGLPLFELATALAAYNIKVF